MRKIRLEFQVFTDDDTTPEWEGVQRIPWPDDQSLEDVARAVVEKVCRELHAPRVVLRNAS